MSNRPNCSISCTNLGMCTAPAGSEISPQSASRLGVALTVKSAYGRADTTITALLSRLASPLSGLYTKLNRNSRPNTPGALTA